MIKFIFAALLLALFWLVWRKWRQAGQTLFIERFPLQERLDRRLAARRPELDATQRAEVLEGLRDYFLISNTAGRRMVAMPSQAVDDAWHEFILFTRQYEQFCHRAFGRFLHHTPAEAMTSPTQAGDGIKRAWRLACAHEGINPKVPDRLPRLFALDARLGIAGGFVYQIDCLAAGGTGSGGYCASHIGCSSGCAGDSGDGSSDGGDGGGGCGGD